MTNDHDETPGSVAYVARAIQALRLVAHYSQVELAAKVGWGSQTISDLERGARQLKVSELLPLAAALNVDPEVILGLTPLPKTPGGREERPPALRHELLSASLAPAFDIDPGSSWHERFLAAKQEAYGMLEQWIHAPAPPCLPVFSRSLGGDAISTPGYLASWCGLLLDLGDRPAVRIEQALETTFRVRIFSLHLNQAPRASLGVHAYAPAVLCGRSDGGTCGIIVSDVTAPGERADLIARAMFLLTSWNSIREARPRGGRGAQEEWQQCTHAAAELFSDLLLLPWPLVRESVGLYCPSDNTPMTTWIIDALAREFGVSRLQMTRRLRQLGYTTPAPSDTGAPHVPHNDAGPTRSPTHSAWYTEMARIAVIRGEIGIARAAALLDLTTSDLIAEGFPDVRENHRQL